MNGTCQHWELVGDGYCDDKTNTQECFYDLKDCCDMKSDRTLCTDCTCTVSKNELQTIATEFKTEFCLGNRHDNLDWYFLGDGICHLNLNKGICIHIGTPHLLCRARSI